MRRVGLVVALAGAVLLIVQSLGTTGTVTSSPPVLAGLTPQAAVNSSLSPGPQRAAAPALAAGSPSAASSASTGDVVAVSLRKDHKIALVDPVSAKITKTVDAGLPPGTIDVAADGRTGWVFSTKPGENMLAVVDLVKGDKLQDRRLHDGPNGAAFSSDGARAYIALSGEETSPPGLSTIAFLNGSGEEFGDVTLGQQTRGVQIHRQLSDLAVATGKSGEELLVAGKSSGVVWALDGGSGAQLAQIEVGGGPLQIVPDAPRHRVYVVVETANQVVAVDTVSLSVTDRVDLPGPPVGAAVAPDGTAYVVGGGDDGQLWVIGAGTTQLVDQKAIGGRPVAVGISSDASQLYVANAADGTLAVVSTATLSAVKSVSLGAEPVNLALARRQSAAGRAVSTGTPGPRGTATPTPTMVPAPTALPEGAKPPEHMPFGALSEDFLGGANMAVSLAFAPDGRLFYSELRTGRIRIVENGTLLPEPFYEFAVAGQPETGLLGLTLDPDFAQNRYLYAFYTSVPGGTESGGTNGPNQVVRLTDAGNHGTELTWILEDLPSGPIHNSGELHFGADGKLYVSLGDNDQGTNAQDLTSLAGKILRVNSDGSVPDDNPFAGQPGKQGAIWAYGLRNPYSFAFHPVGHQLLAVENGPGDNDELDVIFRGGNYGWPPTGYKYHPGVVDPIAVINPPIGPSGSTFYVGEQIPAWKNDWFYCNYHQGQLRRVHLAPSTYDRIVYEEVVKQGCNLAVATGPDGALYYSDVKGIYRIRRPGAPVLPAVVPAAAASAAATPTQVLSAGTRPEDRDLNVTLVEWKVVPSRTTLPAGSVRFLAENTGATPHSLRIIGNGLDVTTETFNPGQSRSVQIALQPGTYQLTCPLPGHVEQGMSALLTVVRDGDAQ